MLDLGGRVWVGYYYPKLWNDYRVDCYNIVMQSGS
jgi:hypothetical protein